MTTDTDIDEDRPESEARPEGDPALQPPVTGRPLPDEVRREREAMAQTDARDRLLYETAINNHLAARTAALDFIEAALDRIADVSDLDLVGDTRPAAAWQMAGRCVGIARLMIDAIALGYTAELPHLARALHEADRLLGAFEFPSEEELLKKWLKDEGKKWVRPNEARDALVRIEALISQKAQDAGAEALKSTEQLNRTVYDQHSQAAHHRRKWVQDNVFPAERMMIRGISDAWIRRAITAHAMVKVIDESIIFTGSCIANFFDPGWFTANIAPLVKKLDELHETQVLPG